MTMTTTLTDAATWQIFATAVRSALSDLPKDEVDDLTDGLEADLAERADDPLAPALGSPADYAAELRAAAGIPVRRSGSAFATAVTSVKHAWAEFAQRLTRHPAASGTLSFFVSLRPIWWVYRAWIVFLWSELGMGSGIHPLPANLASFLILTIALIVSVQFGRGRWMRWSGFRVLLALLNIVLVVSLPIVAIWAENASGYGYY
jgi:hypothetical protein